MTTTTKTTKTTKAATKTAVSGITPTVKVTEIDWEYQRAHQSKPLAKDEVDLLIADLSAAVTGLTFASKSDRYYFGIRAARDGKTVAEYWAKKDFPRLIIHAKARDGVTFPVDLAKRTALKPEERGSEILNEIPDEYVVTPAEAIEVLKALGAKPAAEPKAAEPAKKLAAKAPAAKKPAAKK